MRKILIVLALCTVTTWISLPAKANVEQVILDSTNQDDPTGQFIKELKTFVRSIGRQKYQPQGYWEEVDTLWESIQLRKQELESQFSSDQRKQIRKWEKRYAQLRQKRSKLS